MIMKAHSASVSSICLKRSEFLERLMQFWMADGDTLITSVSSPFRSDFYMYSLSVGKTH